MSDEINYIEEIQSIEQDRQDISECFQSFGILSLKVHAQPLSGRINLGERKLNTAISNVQEKVAGALNVNTRKLIWIIALLKMLTYHGLKQKILTG